MPLDEQHRLKPTRYQRVQFAIDSLNTCIRKEANRIDLIGDLDGLHSDQVSEPECLGHRVSRGPSSSSLRILHPIPAGCAHPDNVRTLILYGFSTVAARTFVEVSSLVLRCCIGRLFDVVLHARSPTCTLGATRTSTKAFNQCSIRSDEYRRPTVYVDRLYG